MTRQQLAASLAGFRLGCLALLAMSATPAAATVLTFDYGDGVVSMDQDYGDRVTAATMGGFSYGTQGGFTPNVVAEYAAGSPIRWTTGYNQLVNVYENENDGADGFALNLVADAGFQVSLFGLQIGNWGAEITLPRLTVFGANGEVLFEQANIVLPSSSLPTLAPFAFAGGLTSSSLSIAIDTTGLGGNSDNVGLDNIIFGQSSRSVVPVPAAAWLMASAIGGIALMARRSRRLASA